MWIWSEKSLQSPHDFIEFFFAWISHEKFHINFAWKISEIHMKAFDSFQMPKNICAWILHDVQVKEFTEISFGNFYVNKN